MVFCIWHAVVHCGTAFALGTLQYAVIRCGTAFALGTLWYAGVMAVAFGRLRYNFCTWYAAVRHHTLRYGFCTWYAVVRCCAPLACGRLWYAALFSQHCQAEHFESLIRSKKGMYDVFLGVAHGWAHSPYRTVPISVCQIS